MAFLTLKHISHTSTVRLMAALISGKHIITRAELFEYTHRCNEQIEKEAIRVRQTLIDEQVLFLREKILRSAKEGKFIVYEVLPGANTRTDVIMNLKEMFPGVSIVEDNTNRIRIDWSGLGINEGLCVK